MLLARVLGGVGRLLIWLGALILLFVAYQLWGTGLEHSRAQDSLESDFQQTLEEFGAADQDDGEEPDEPAATTTTVPAPPPAEGDSVAHLVIPAVGVDEYVVEGVSRSDLQKGPGHYPDSPMPGQPGNAAIAGHRTTYGQPFHDVDKLTAGDEIVVTTVQGTFYYEVMGTEIVSPSAVEVLDDFDDDRLTLTSCHPKYSASQRIIVTAELTTPPAPAPPPPPDTPEAATPEVRDVIDGEERGPWGPVILWGLLGLGIWLAFYLLGRWWKQWPSYALGLVPFAVVLFVFYGHVERLLPSGY